MFNGCKFQNLDTIKNWNISNGKFFGDMFGRCASLLNLNGLKNVSNGTVLKKCLI